MSTNQSLNPKLKIVAIYNKRRVDQGLSPINVADYSFSNPIQYAGVKSTKNTRIYLTPNTSSSQFGRITIYYDRIDLSSVVGARVIKHDATTIVELLPSINEELGVELSALDIVDGQLTDNLNFVLRASPNSLVFTGSTSIGYYVDENALFPAEGTILEAGKCNTVSFYKYNLVADGMGGVREDILDYNSTECGFSLPVPVITVRTDNPDIVLPITSHNNIVTLIASMSNLRTYVGYQLAWFVMYPGTNISENFYTEQFIASSESKERVKYLELNTNIPLTDSAIIIQATLGVINNITINSGADTAIRLHLTPPTTITSNPTSPPSTSATGTTSTSTTPTPTTSSTLSTSSTGTTSTTTTTTTPSTTPTTSLSPTTSSTGTTSTSTTTTTTTTPSTTPTPSPVDNPTLVSTIANTRTLTLTEPSSITAITTGNTLLESYNTGKINFNITLSNPSILDPAGVNYIVKVILKSDTVVISNTGNKTTIEPGILYTGGIKLIPSNNSKSISFDIETDNATTTGPTTAGKVFLSYTPITYLLFGEGTHILSDFNITTEVYQSSNLVATTTKTYTLEYLRDKILRVLQTVFSYDNTGTPNTNTFVKTNAVVELPIHLTDRPLTLIKTNTDVAVNTSNSTSFYKFLKSLVSFTNFTDFKNEVFNLRIYKTSDNTTLADSTPILQEYFYTGNDLFSAEETPRYREWKVTYNPDTEIGTTHPVYYHFVFTGSLGRKKASTYVQAQIAQWFQDLWSGLNMPRADVSLNGSTPALPANINLPITDQNKNVRVDFAFRNLTVGYSYIYKLELDRTDIQTTNNSGSNFDPDYKKLLLEGTITATATTMNLTRYFAIDPTYLVDSTKLHNCNITVSTYSVASVFSTNAISPRLITTGTTFINININSMLPNNNIITNTNKTLSFDTQLFFIDTNGNILGLPPDIADNYQLELWSRKTDPLDPNAGTWYRGRYKGDINVPVKTITNDNPILDVDFSGMTCPNGDYTVAFRLYKKTTKLFIASTATYSRDNSFFNPVNLTYNF